MQNLPERGPRILLGSGGFSLRPATMDFLPQEADRFLGSVEKVVLIPYAKYDSATLQASVAKMKLVGQRKMESITTFSDPQKAIREAQALFIWGGNTFRLLDHLYRNDLLGVIRQRVAEGMPYIGVSAGTNVACPTIKTTNDMPIVCPPSLDAIGLVPFQINPHYVFGRWYSQSPDGTYVPYAGETRDIRINEYHEENELPVLGIPEATFLKIENGKATYLALDEVNCRLFKKGEGVQEFPPGSDLSEFLK
jgi:dipeptidase E